MTDLVVDVVVIGGGPAGLAASLSLGRAAKRVLLCDGGLRRNARAEHMHGFVTRDGVAPPEFRRIARAQLSPYDVVTNDSGVEAIDRAPNGGLVVRTSDGARVECRRVLLAMGLIDEVPDIEGLREHWGQTVFACPYCHGWELRGRPWAMLATDASHFDHALLLSGWTDDLVVVTSTELLAPEIAERLEATRIRTDTRAIRRVHSGADGRLKCVELEGGARLPVAALIVKPAQRQTSLVQSLALALDERDLVRTDADAETSMPGVHAAGDLSEPMQAAMIAAAAGTRAAYRINYLLNAAPSALLGAPETESRGPWSRGRWDPSRGARSR